MTSSDGLGFSTATQQQVGLRPSPHASEDHGSELLDPGMTLSSAPAQQHVLSLAPQPAQVLQSRQHLFSSAHSQPVQQVFTDFAPHSAQPLPRLFPSAHDDASRPAVSLHAEVRSAPVFTGQQPEQVCNDPASSPAVSLHAGFHPAHVFSGQQPEQVCSDPVSSVRVASADVDRYVGATDPGSPLRQPPDADLFRARGSAFRPLSAFGLGTAGSYGMSRQRGFPEGASYYSTAPFTEDFSRMRLDSSTAFTGPTMSGFPG